MLEVRGITKRFGATVALDGVSLTMDGGEAALLRGPSGCGKTTLLRLIAGLIAPDSGEIWLNSVRASGPGRLTRPDRRGIAFAFQEPRLWPHMTARQNVAFALSALKPAERAERLNLVSASTGATPFLARYPAELSVGQARRVALARALAPKRPLILMDEPLTNLDGEARRDLGEVIRRFWTEEQFTLVYVTHETTDELNFIRRTVRIDKGRIEG
jgi:iron(III) transport system ATP-binding protein